MKEFEKIIVLLEQMLNEVSDDLVDEVSKKRAQQKADAFMHGTKDDYEKASKKDSKNFELTTKRDDRHGVRQTKNGRVSKEKSSPFDLETAGMREYQIYKGKAMQNEMLTNVELLKNFLNS